MADITMCSGTSNCNSSFGTLTTITGTTGINNWNYPERIEVREVGESIEMVYKQTSSFSRTGGLPPYHDTRLFKIVYSCVDGKWNKSEPIYGKIIPTQDEYYEFED
jgi:hypothetical protein